MSGVGARHLRHINSVHLLKARLYLHCSGVASHIANSPANLSVGLRPITMYEVSGLVRIKATAH